MEGGYGDEGSKGEHGKKNRYMITGGVRPEPVQLGRYPCAVRGRGVGVNSILCVSCGKWCHKKCSGLRAQNMVVNFKCLTCVGEVPDVRDNLMIDGETLQEVREFTYLGECNKHIPLKSRGAVYAACVRSVLLYGSETWSITRRQEQLLTSCDRRFLRYMTGVRMTDRISNQQVANRCGQPQLLDVIRERRLSWYGHVRRRGEGEILADILDIEVPGPRPRGRPRKN